MVLVHELGHATSAALLIPGDVRLYVYPGHELFPDWGRQFPETWPEKSPALTYVRPDIPIGAWPFTPGTQGYAVMKRNDHLIRLMGSASTLLLALASLALIALLKPRGVALWILGAGALLHMDLLTGTVFPVFFDARHLYFWGGESPETVDALTGLGVPERISVTAVILVSTGLCVWHYWLLRFKLRRGRQ
jgi:hypothetical protein